MSQFLKDSTMQNEERSKLEERIIAYFDGSLDGEGSSSLLREVAENPEKRALFTGHETLSRLIAAAREPLEAPLEVKRSIAEKIPGMLAFLPGLFGAAETAPVFTENTNPFIEFFSRMSLSTAAAIGGAIAVLVTSAILLKNNLDRQPVTSSSPKIGAVRSATSAGAKMNFAPATVPASSVAEGNLTKRVAGISRIAKVVRAKGNLPEAMPSDYDIDASSELASLTPPIPTNGVVTVPSNLIPNQNIESLRSLPIMAGEGVTIRPYFSDGYRLVSLNGINGPGSAKPFQSELVGVEFDLGDRYAFRVQGGTSSFAAFSTQERASGSESLITSSISAKPAWWSTLGVSYSFSTFAAVPLILSGDAGAVWFTNPGLPGPGLMARLGLATEIPIFNRLAIRPSLTYDAVYTSWTPQSSGIFVNPVDENSMWSTALGFNLGFVIRY